MWLQTLDRYTGNHHQRPQTNRSSLLENGGFLKNTQNFLYKQRLKISPQKILNSGCSRHIYPRLLIPAVVERHNPLKRRTLLLWLLSHCQAKRRFVRLLSPYTDVNIQGQRKHYPKQLAGFCLLEVTPRIRASPLSR